MLSLVLLTMTTEWLLRHAVPVVWDQQRELFCSL